MSERQPSSQGDARFVIYRDGELLGAADDITQALAQAKTPGDLLNACAIHDKANQVIIIATGWVAIGGEGTLQIPDEAAEVRRAFSDGFSAGRRQGLKDAEHLEA